MQLICDYAAEPPIVVGHVPDGVTLDMTHDHLANFVVVPWPDALERRPKVGPEPELMGDPPTECYPGEDELQREGVPRFILGDDGEPLLDADGHKVRHPFWVRAGKPYPDNRRRAIDTRPFEAPPQSDPDVQRAYLAHARWSAEIAGIVVDGFPASTARGDVRLQQQADAARASRDPKFTKRVKGADGAFHTLDAGALVKVADAVSDHVESCFGVEDALASDIADSKIESFKPIDAAFAKLRPVATAVVAPT